MNNQLDGLLALKLVAEHRNFTATANILRVSPSAVSQVIKQLESRLGIALLSRTTRTTSLTEAGKKFLDQAGPALDQILTALQDVKSYAKKPMGLLRLNMPRSIYTYLEPIILSFIKKYPDISVELFFEDATSDIVESGFDAGIRHADILAKDMVAMKLFGPLRFVIAGAPKYFKKMGYPKHPKDLLTHNCIRLRFGTDKLYDCWEFIHKGKEFQVQVKGSLIANDPLLMKQAALNGAGIIYTTENAIKDKVAAGKLEIVLNQYACTSAGFYLYYPKRSQVLPKLRAFIEHVRETATIP